MTQRESASLRDGVWLNDAPITFFLKACVQDTNRGVHCFCSGFFKFIDLCNEEYHYDSIRAFVRRQFDRYENGINSLKQLFTPINILNTHWIFLRVEFESKRIELYDSNGKNPENRRYMENMRQFLYNEFHKDTLVEERPPYDNWKRMWKYTFSTVRYLTNGHAGELPPYYSNPTLLPRHRGWTLPTIIALPNESNIAKKLREIWGHVARKRPSAANEFLATRGEGAPRPRVQHVTLQIVLPAQQRST